MDRSPTSRELGVDRRWGKDLVGPWDCQAEAQKCHGPANWEPATKYVGRMWLDRFQRPSG